MKNPFLQPYNERDFENKLIDKRLSVKKKKKKQRKRKEVENTDYEAAMDRLLGHAAPKY